MWPGGRGLYAEPYDPQRPVVCFDASTQLLAETRPSLPPRLLPLEQDYESQGYPQPVPGLFDGLAAGGGDPAAHHLRPLRWLVDEAYPETPVVRVVIDHVRRPCTRRSRRQRPGGTAKRLEFHYTPKHGSWLNPDQVPGYGRLSSVYPPAPA